MKKNPLDFSLSFYTKNTNAEVILVYFWAVLTLAIFGLRYWTSFTPQEKFHFGAISLLIAVFAISAFYLIINFKKIKEKYFSYHNDWQLGSGIQALGLPVIVGAWALFLIYNIAPNFPQFFSVFFNGQKISNQNFWLSFILFIYVIFSSIRSFTKITAKTDPNFQFDYDKVEMLDIKIWQLILSTLIASIYFINNLGSLGYAFANTFILNDLLFDFIYYLTRILKK